jgi:hypothetical protein
MPDILSAIDLRRWAAQCAEQANGPNLSGEDRDRLLRMRDSLLALAENADWLAGSEMKKIPEAVTAH